MGFKTIILTNQSGISTLTLNRPEKMNSLSDQMLDEINAAINEVAKNREVRVLVITGAGKAFSAGADLDHSIFRETTDAGKRRKLAQFHSIPIKLRSLAIPVIASVNGVAVGAAANIALACDIVVASEEARFGQVFVNIGLHVDTGGTYFLPRSVGTTKAMELMLTGDIINAKEAERIGMINKVVPVEELERFTRNLAQRLAQGPPAALGMIKASIYENQSKDLSSALDREAKCQISLLNSEHNREGIRAFREKRRPLFK